MKCSPVNVLIIRGCDKKKKRHERDKLCHSQALKWAFVFILFIYFWGERLQVSISFHRNTLAFSCSSTEDEQG